MDSYGRQRGFTLIETLMTAVIGGVLLIGVFTFLGRATQKAAAYAETSEMDERRSTFADLVRIDLDRAGSNLLYSPVVPGGLVPGLFEQTDQYDAAPGTLSKTGDAGLSDSTTLTTTIVSGEGYIDYTPPPAASMVSFFSLYNNSYRLIYIDAAADDGSANVFIVEDGWNVVSTPPQHQPGDSYRIAAEPDAAIGRVINYYRVRNGTRSLLYTSRAPMLIYPIGTRATLEEKGAQLTGIQFFASVMSDASAAGAQLPPLPFDTWTGRRLAGALTTIKGTPLGAKRAFIVFAGDRSVDPVFVQADFPGSARVKVNAPARGSFQGGDYVFVVERTPGVSAAALFQVESAAADASGYYLNLTRVTSEAAAWQRLYSAESDFDHTFSAGSLLVKLAPPVTYAMTVGNRIVRSESYLTKDPVLGYVQGENTATALLGVNDFNIEDTSASGNLSYMVSLTLSTEGYETGATTQTYTYKATPRALNGTPDWTNLLPQN